MSQVSQSYCRNCPAACGLLVESEAGRIISVKGDPEHALSAGYMCIKGAMSAEMHDLDPSRRKSKKRRDGGFEDIGVEDALDEIQARLADIVARHGPQSVALHHGTGVKMNTLGMMSLKSWLQDLGSPYLYSSSTIDQSAKWVTAGRLGLFPTGKPTFAESDVVMLVGVNPAVSHMGMFVLPFAHPIRALREGKKTGTKLIVVDPRKTETARYADIHLQIKPGEDVALFAGMFRMVLDQGWEDNAFCSRHVVNVDVLRDAVRSYTPEYTAERSGIDIALLAQATELFAKSARHSATSGTGPNMSPYSNLAEHLIEALNVICGAYRRPGDTIAAAGAFFASAPTRAAQAIAPNRTWERGPKCFTVDSGMLAGEFPTSRIPAEIRGSDQGRIRALFVIGGNLSTALGDPDGTLAAFRELELLVTVDPMMTETGAVSDYFIPTAMPYERHDVSAIQDALFAEPFAQVTSPQVRGPEGVIEDSEFFWGLARRAGTTLTLRGTKVGQAASSEGGIALDMVRKPETEELVRAVCENSGLSYDDLRMHPGGLRIDRAPVLVVARDGQRRPARCDAGGCRVRVASIRAGSGRFAVSVPAGVPTVARDDGQRISRVLEHSSTLPHQPCFHESRRHVS